MCQRDRRYEKEGKREIENKDQNKEEKKGTEKRVGEEKGREKNLYMLEKGEEEKWKKESMCQRDRRYEKEREKRDRKQGSK